MSYDDGVDPHWRGIYDLKGPPRGGAICNDMDLGDAWEYRHDGDPRY